MDLDHISPRLHRNVIFLLTEEGVLIKRFERETRLRGAGAYHLMERLAPHLDGTTTTGDLCRDLPAGKADAVRALIACLIDHGYATAATEVPASCLTPAERLQFSGILGLLDEFSDAPEERFARCRNSRALVVGGGPQALAVVHALVDLGVLRIEVATDGQGIDAERITAYLETVPAGLPRPAVSLAPGAAPGAAGELAALSGLAAASDGVLWIHDGRRAPAVPRPPGAEDGRTPFVLPIFPGEDLGMVGPTLAEGGAGCLPCAFRALEEALASSPTRAAENRRLGASPGAVASLANVAAIEYFKVLTGLEATRLVDNVFLLDPETLGGTILHYGRQSACSCARAVATFQEAGR